MKFDSTGSSLRVASSAVFEIEWFAVCRGPHGAVAVGGHLAEFFDFLRVVDGAEGRAAAAVNVDAVGDPVVVSPVPGLVDDRFAEFRNGGLGFDRRGAVNGVRQNRREQPVAVVVGQESIGGDRFG